MKIQEGELPFDFSGARSVDKLDKEGVPQPHNMKFVDFVIEEDERILLVEVKDPSSFRIPGLQKKKLGLEKLKNFRRMN